MKWLLFAIIWIGAAGVVAMPAASAQAPSVSPKTVWDGVYSATQAERGKNAYEAHCRNCHGDDLGGGDGPGLLGQPFLRNWLEDNLDSLFTKIQTRMPADAPDSLEPGMYADLLSFLLQANGFPGGARDLTPDHPALARIQIVGKDGPAAVPDSSLVEVVGCLSKGGNSGWLLAKGTEPARTRDPGPSSTVEMQTWDAKSLGTQTFNLLDVGSLALDSYKNRKMLVKGFLLRRPGGASLNATWAGPLTTPCSAD